MLTIKVALIEEGDGTVIEAKGMVIGEGEGVGTKTPNISSRDIPNNPNTQTPTIIICLQWGTNININCPMINKQITLNSNKPTPHQDRLHNHAKLQIYVNYVRIKAIMITNANLQVTLWPVHKRLLVRCRGITRIHRSPSRPRPAVRPTAAFINIHEQPL